MGSAENGRTIVFLSPPHMPRLEEDFVHEALDTNRNGLVGPYVDAFEGDVGVAIGAKHAAASSSGTAGLHLALLLAGLRAGDDVFCSTPKFAASANPIVHASARKLAS